MKKSLCPGTFRRVVEISLFIENQEQISHRDLQNILKVSENRSKEILSEMVKMGLISEKGNQYTRNETTKQFLSAIQEDDWRVVHKIMMGYPFYSIFYDEVKKKGPIELNDLTYIISNEEFNFNATAFSVISDWTLRIESLQRNVFNNHYYDVGGTTQLFTQSLLDIYDDLNQSGNGNFKPRYVEIPRIREYVCENLKITRKKFDTAFIENYENNIGEWELIGAPVTTHAKESKKKIKSLVFSQMLDRMSTEPTANRYLHGIQYGKKHYYYLAIHSRCEL